MENLALDNVLFVVKPPSRVFSGREQFQEEAKTKKVTLSDMGIICMPSFSQASRMVTVFLSENGIALSPIKKEMAYLLLKEHIAERVCKSDDKALKETWMGVLENGVLTVEAMPGIVHSISHHNQIKIHDLFDLSEERTLRLKQQITEAMLKK